MQLVPALKIGNKIYAGDERDSHNGIAVKNNILAPESSRGFSPDSGKTFLTRLQAIGWLKKYERATFRKLPGVTYYRGLHSEDLAKARGIAQYPPAQEMSNSGKNIGKPDRPVEAKPVKEKVDLSDKVAMVYDRGLYLYLAERLAQDFKKVHYYLPQAEPYPTSKLHPIATGIPKVERCFDFWGTLPKCDIVIFPDTYDGSLQEFLRAQGFRVFGSGKGEKVETDKVFFMECLEKVGLPVPKTYLAEGIDDLLQYLEKNPGEKWLKGNTRGDFETKKFTDMDHFQPFLDDLRFRLGKRTETIEILVQDPVESECEAGYDGFQVDGEYTKNCLCGYEVKDRAFVAAVVAEPGPPVKVINDAFAPIFKDLGYRGAYSTEVRITKDGMPYYIDPTTRFGSPPGELMSLLYENYSEIIWAIAGGEVPLPKPAMKYGAQMILTSDWYRDGHEMYIEFPKKYKDNIKLSNYYVKDGKTFIVPNETEQYFGSVVAIGSTIDEAVDECKKVLKEIKCEKFKWDENAFEEAQEIIENGKKFGLEF